MPKLLQGIKVLDLTRLLPGPLCTLWLQNLGAEVVKIEPPEGDYTKMLSPDLYQKLNKGKQIESLNLKEADDRLRFLEMAEAADVLVESFRPGVTKKIGIDYATIKALNPAIIYCSISGYGQEGEMRDQPGHDINYLAYAGILHQMQGLANFPIADVAGGSLPASVGILAALVSKQKTGRGHYIDVSMLECVKALNLLAQTGPDLLNGDFPFYNVYETSDGRRIALGALELKFWQNFCEAVERLDWISLHSTHPKQWPSIKGELEVFFKNKTMQEWSKLLEKKDCCFSPVLTVAEAGTRLPDSSSLPLSFLG